MLRRWLDAPIFGLLGNFPQLTNQKLAPRDLSWFSKALEALELTVKDMGALNQNERGEESWTVELPR